MPCWKLIGNPSSEVLVRAGAEEVIIELSRLRFAELRAGCSCEHTLSVPGPAAAGRGWSVMWQLCRPRGRHSCHCDRGC